MNTRTIFSNILRFILLIVLQIFFFNYVLVGGIGTPLIYPLFILLLPINIPPVTILILSFGSGLLIDVLSNGGGVHAASLTAMGFLRKPVLDMLMPQSGYEKNELPSLQQQKTRWFAIYTTSLILLHHTVFFFLEIFSVQNFFTTILRTFLSSGITLLLVWLTALFLVPSKKIR